VSLLQTTAKIILSLVSTDFNLVVNVSLICDNLISDIKVNKNFPNPVVKKVEYVNAILQQTKMFKYDSKVKIPAGADLKIEEYFAHLEKYNSNYRYRTDYQNLLEFNTTKHEFLNKLIEENKDIAFLKKISQEKERKNKTENKSDNKNENPLMKTQGANKVLIFPAFQFNYIKQNDDRETLEGLLGSEYFTKINIASGYMNLPDFIVNILNRSKYDLNIYTAAPKSNGFYKAGFIKKYIPYFYRRFEYNLLRNLKKENFNLLEYEKEGWTFHSKGLWFYEKDKNHPTMTVVGSSNLSIISLYCRP
jgi:hypothetical protein